jgi:hypothetical protein
MSESNVPVPSALSLKGRRALVTGAASGIGRAPLSHSRSLAPSWH